MRRTVTALLGALGLLVVMAVPAQAVTKDGSQSCASNRSPYAAARYYGSGSLSSPGGSTDSLRYSSGWRTQTNYSAYGSGGGYWRAYSNGGLHDPGTFAGCQNGFP